MALRHTSDDLMRMMIPRDLSWLSFNERVLQEVARKDSPLFERIKFLAIYSNNLDEFFKIRVANHRNLVRLGKKTKAKLDYDPKAILKTIHKVVNRQQAWFTQLFVKEIIPELAKNGIEIVQHNHLREEQIDWVSQYFNDYLLPYSQPVLLLPHKIRPFLNNGALYLIALLEDKSPDKKQKAYAIVKVPSDHLPRFVQLPSKPGKHEIIFLDDIVRMHIPWLFPGYNVISTFSIKLTRDAELYIDDEFSGDLIAKIRKSLTKRNVGPASRLVYDREMDAETLAFLQEMFELESIDLFPEGRYHNNMDLFHFPHFEKSHLQLENWPQIPLLPLQDAKDYYATIRSGDHLINPPYHAFEAVIRFFEEAAIDPLVRSVRLVQYRVGSQSRIMEALKKAAVNGKSVTVFIEVKARFDEEANLRWGEDLERYGVKVHYSLPGIKVHSKLALVERLESNGIKHYAYLSTGNFHERTSTAYSDLGLFTADNRITTEVAAVFSFLESIRLPEQDFEHLLVGQFNMNYRLRAYIQAEIEAAEKGLSAGIDLKLNSLQDPEFIEWLYKASLAGVKVRLIIRGICCLIPGIKGISDHIRVISIVDRFLEHSRVIMFHNGGNRIVYLSSADWMTRNLHYRIETAFPIYNPEIRERIIELFEIQWRDNTHARIIDEHQKNKIQNTHNQVIKHQSQRETHAFWVKHSKKTQTN